MSELFEELRPYLDKGMALSTSLAMLEWDMETLAPIDSQDQTSKVVGILSEEYFLVYNNPYVKNILNKLLEPQEFSLLNESQQAVVRELKRLFDQLEPIPKEDYKKYSELTAKAPHIWAKAKENNNFTEFSQTLFDIISFNKEFAGYRAKAQGKSKEDIYDILLEDYEPGFRREQLDPLFDKIKKEIVPIIKKQEQRQIDKSYNFRHYPMEKQRGFCRWIAEYIGFNFNRGVLAESAHPFTTNFHNKDVRITTHYYENNLESAIFSVIHEVGHGLYEMNIDDSITQSLIGTGASMGMHESQSRFYENIIGKSKAFWQPIFPKLVETFPESLQDVNLDHFIQGINQSTPGPIRTEADELTYPLHIVIRYEIEKLIFSNEINISDLPEIWNNKYEEYLGIRPQNFAEGILQDVHWSCGNFGYFPSYAIGSAVAAQIYHHIKNQMPFETYLQEGNIKAVGSYLDQYIHKHGMKKNTNQLLQDMMGESFNPDYYIRYLKDKFSDLGTGDF